MHIRQPILFVALLSLGGCTLADLDPGHAEAVQSCAGTDASVSAESRIDSCSALLRAGKESPGTLAIILTSRGTAYASLGGYDRAIQDFDRALKAKPDTVVALLNRGNAYLARANMTA